MEVPVILVHPHFRRWTPSKAPLPETLHEFDFEYTLYDKERALLDEYVKKTSQIIGLSSLHLEAMFGLTGWNGIYDDVRVLGLLPVLKSPTRLIIPYSVSVQAIGAYDFQGMGDFMPHISRIKSGYNQPEIIDTDIEAPSVYSEYGWAESTSPNGVQITQLQVLRRQETLKGGDGGYGMYFDPYTGELTVGDYA